MENQTRYDLNAAIEGWRQELAAQANLTLAVRRELETHLLDAITGFQQRGLNDEESFWLARRRVGQPQQLGEEFVKADPVNAWRERLFWICLAGFLLGIWGSVVGCLQWTLLPFNSSTKHVESSILASLVTLAPVVAVVIVVLRRSEKVIRRFSKLRPLLENRLRLAFTALALTAMSSTCYVISQARTGHWSGPGQLLGYSLFRVAGQVIFALVLIWLVPSQKRKTLKRA